MSKDELKKEVSCDLSDIGYHISRLSTLISWDEEEELESFIIKELEKNIKKLEEIKECLKK